jgi:hypothetical protein
MKQLFVIGLTAVSALALGREVSTYSVELNIESAGNLVSRSHRGQVSIGSGWSCEAKAALNTEVYLKDFKGEARRVAASQPQPTGYSLLANPIFQTTFSRNSGAPQAQAMDLGEYCEECHTESYVTTDANGNMQTTYYTVCSNAHLKWSCPLAESASEIGRSIEVSCKLVGESLGYSVPRAKLKYLHRETMKARFVLLQKSEQFDVDLCQGRTRNKAVLSLRQGVGGHRGEDDFRFLVQVGNETPIQIKSKTGILNHDIAICPNETKVRVKVWAYEKDLFFDDKYLPVDRNGVEFNLADGSQEREIELKRRSFTGATPRKHIVSVGLTLP